MSSLKMHKWKTSIYRKQWEAIASLGGSEDMKPYLSFSCFSNHDSGSTRRGYPHEDQEQMLYYCWCFIIMYMYANVCSWHSPTIIVIMIIWDELERQMLVKARRSAWPSVTYYLHLHCAQLHIHVRSDVIPSHASRSARRHSITFKTIHNGSRD